MLALALASLAATDRAQAACLVNNATPASPVINQTVSCTGTTTNQNGTTGFGLPQDSGNTINVQPTATQPNPSVTGTDIGIQVSASGNADDGTADTINNFGTISGAIGVRGFTLDLNNNAGATISGTSNQGILLDGSAIVANSGGVSGITVGLEIQNADVTNTTTGVISGGTVGVEIHDAASNGMSAPTVSNAGIINGVTNGVLFNSQNLRPGQLTNSGSITATGP